MSRDRALNVANAVLYEGYMLYPYRPSAVKNRQRWSFGILYPPAYEEVGRGTERSAMHSEVLLKVPISQHAPAGENTRENVSVQMQLRFLHLDTSDEAIERFVEFELSGRNYEFHFGFPGTRDVDLRHGSTVERVQHEITGTVTAEFTSLADNVLKLTIDVSNTTALSGSPTDRDSALLRSLLSAHTILTVSGGEFISLLDAPADLREAVSACRNIGNFPVLVGEEGERDMMLCSPILLYDYPQVAPESAGDFYDATEMDEMLTLRVMTLTDEEKNEMRSANDHARNLLERTEASAREQLKRTHGTIRNMRPVGER